MRPSRRMIGVLMAPCVAWSACLWAQTSKSSPGAASPATVVRPVQVDVLSLQVSKLPRDPFGHGIKPGTNETMAFWLANSGTAVDLRIKVDRPIARFDEPASRLIRFADDKDHDLTRPPGGEPVNTFFNDNKPIIVKPGPEAHEAEVILRGFGTPAPGATKVKIHADLVFLAGSEERIAERKGLEPTPGTSATIGPLHLRFIDPQRVGPPGGRLPVPVDAAQGTMTIAFEYERSERPIKSVACLNSEGEQVAALEGRSFNSERGSTVWFGVPEMRRIHLRVAYFEKSGTITVPVRLETGVGF